MHEQPDTTPASYHRLAAQLAPEAARPMTSGNGIVRLKTWPTVASALLQVAPPGPRLPSGLPSLDQVIRGGLLSGTRCMLVGSPDAFKTALIVQWGHVWRRLGAAVVIVAADEPHRKVAVRIAQRSGYRRDDLEGEDDSVRREAAARLDDPELLLLDGDDFTVEDAIEAVETFGPQRQRVLLIDSLQTVRCAAAAGARSLHEEITTLTKVLRSAAKAGVTVVATSEMSRAGFKHANRDQNISALASGKESGSIEFRSDLLLALRKVPDAVGLSDMEVAKNKLGQGYPELRVRLDFTTLEVSEIEKPEGDAKAAGGASNRAKKPTVLTEIKTEIKRVIMENELRSRSEIAMAIRRGQRKDRFAVINSLLEAGDIVQLESGLFRVVTPEDAT